MGCRGACGTTAKTSRRSSSVGYLTCNKSSHIIYSNDGNTRDETEYVAAILDNSKGVMLQNSAYQSSISILSSCTETSSSTTPFPPFAKNRSIPPRPVLSLPPPEVRDFFRSVAGDPLCSGESGELSI